MFEHASPQKVVEWAVAQWGDEVVASSSFGAESALLGVALVVLGIVGRNPVMIYIGAGVLGVVLLAGLVGHHVS
jgi:hypothetical protein